MRMRSLLAVFLLLVTSGWAHLAAHIVDNATLTSLLAGLFNPERLQEAMSLTGAPEPCARHLKLWADGIHRGERWALQMADSSSKLHAEVFYGVTLDMGHFDNCVLSSSGGSDPVTGSYFLPSLTVVDFTRNRTGVAVMAVCSPRSCPVAELSTALNLVLAWLTDDLGEMGLLMNVSLAAPLKPYSQREPGRPEWIVLGLFAVLLVVALLGSAIDILMEAPAKRRCLRPLLAFSVVSNSRRLVAEPRSPGTFPAINGLRVISIMWVIIVHRWFTYRKWPINTTATSFEQESRRVLFLQGFLAVDTFFAIGGLVCCYSFHCKMARTPRFRFHQHILHRLLRLTPALAACVAFTATWADQLGQGPLAASQEMGETCREGWWLTMLYVGNFLSLRQCLPQTWYLAADLQLHVLAPLVLLPLFRWPRPGLALLLGLIAAACVPAIIITLMYGLNGPYGHFETNKTKWHISAVTMYLPFYCRISPYLVGVLAGHLLYLDKKNKFSLLRSKVMVAFLWTLSTALALVILFWGVRVSAVINDSNPIESAFYNGFFRLAWSSAICWVIIACATGSGGPVNFILSWTGFAFFARLSFGVYLVHYTLQSILDDWKRSAVYYTGLTVFTESLSDAALSYLVSIALYLLVEEPFVQLDTMIWKREGEHPKQSKADPAAEREEKEKASCPAAASRL